MPAIYRVRGVHKDQVVTITKVYQLFLQVLRDCADKGGAI